MEDPKLLEHRLKNLRKIIQSQDDLISRLRDKLDLKQNELDIAIREISQNQDVIRSISEAINMIAPEYKNKCEKLNWLASLSNTIDFGIDTNFDHGNFYN